MIMVMAELGLPSQFTRFSPNISSASFMAPNSALRIHFHRIPATTAEMIHGRMAMYLNTWLPRSGCASRMPNPRLATRVKATVKQVYTTEMRVDSQKKSSSSSHA